jgi:hypothetical protein
MAEDGRSRLSKFQKDAILESFTMKNFWFGQPVLLLATDVLQEKVLHRRFFPGRAGNFTKLLQE